MVAKLLALVLPLGLDTFAVAAALGMAGVTGRVRARVSVLFTGFEAAMPLVGVALGVPLGHAIGRAADYLAVAILLAFGLHTLLHSDDDEPTASQLGEVRGVTALLLGLSISLDELAIGFTIGLLRLPVVPVIVLIAVQTFIVTQLGLLLGDRLSERFREAAERIAGLALTALGLVLLAENLLS